MVLDDPLSAVDAHVAEKLFSDAILGLKARGKTVILVTHALHFLPRVDYVYCLSDGLIREEGTYSSLVSSGGVFSALMSDFGNEHEKETKSADEDGVEVISRDVIGAAFEGAKKKGKVDRSNAEGTGKIEGYLIVKEARKTGHISSVGAQQMFAFFFSFLTRRIAFDHPRTVYTSYISSGGGIPAVLLVVVSAALMQGTWSSISFWRLLTFHCSRAGAL